MTATDDRRRSLVESPVSAIAATYPPQSPPHDAVLVPVVHALVDEWVQAARTFGPLPPLRSEAFLDAEPAQQVAALLVVAEAWLIADPHRVVRTLTKQVADAIHAGDSAHWRNWAVNHVPYAELQRRRAIPASMARRSAS